MSTIAPNPTVPVPTLPAATPTGITAEEFVRLYGHRHAEVVNGVVVLLDEYPGGTPPVANGEFKMAMLRHGKACGRVSQFLANHVDAHDCGQVMCNDSFVVTVAEPLQVRGPDVCYYSYERLPRGDVPDGLIEASPDLAVEVRSPSETWGQVFTKVGEYLAAGVRVVVVLDSPTRSASVYRPDARQEAFEADTELTIPDVLPGFTVQVGKLFA